MNRRGFLGSLVALVAAVFVRVPSKPVCGRCGRVHQPVDIDRIIRDSARQMADDIDRRVFEQVMATMN